MYDFISINQMVLWLNVGFHFVEVVTDFSIIFLGIRDIMHSKLQYFCPGPVTTAKLGLSWYFSLMAYVVSILVEQ